MAFAVGAEGEEGTRESALANGGDDLGADRDEKGETDMRWEKPELLTSRIARRFLFLPAQYPIGGPEGREEWRWLEWAYVEQVYWGFMSWRNFYWAEKPQGKVL